MNLMPDALAMPEQEIFVLGFQRWKRSVVRRFFPGKQLRFIEKPEDLPAMGTVLVWGMRFAEARFPEGIRLFRVEDGFIRSVGLGAELVRPLSWVIDDLGLYYDATQVSRLEKILAETDFSPDLLGRARQLQKALKNSGITKYNVGHERWQRPASARRVILVPGQVETDASIRYGAPVPPCTIHHNMALLEAVRTANPDAYIVYKPHPDVLAGLRLSGLREEQALRWCDELVTEVAMGPLLEAVDEVHVLTSLAGFEALVRDKPVTCYGQPFYAGWGLTRDIFPLPRRTRKLLLPELIAGVLLIYPRYVSHVDGRFMSAEACLSELREIFAKQTRGLPIWRKILRFILSFSRW